MNLALIIPTFLLGAVNIPCALWKRNKLAWFSWMACGFCWGLAVAMIINS